MLFRSRPACARIRPKLALLFRIRQLTETEFDTRRHRARETHAQYLISLISVPDAFEESRKRSPQKADEYAVYVFARTKFGKSLNTQLFFNVL